MTWQRRSESQVLWQHPHWAFLRAVKTGQVYVTDGNQYFNRPGPRLVDSVEILAEILQPELISPQHQGQGWRSLQDCLASTTVKPF